MGKQLMGFQKYSFPFMLGFHSGKGFLCLRIKSKFSRRWAVLQPRAKPRFSLRGPLALALAVCEWARGGGGFLGGGYRLLRATSSSPSHSCCVVAEAREHSGSVVR